MMSIKEIVRNSAKKKSGSLGKGFLNGEPIICPDEVVAILEITKEKCVFTDDFFGANNRKDTSYKNELPTIVLLLESPHIREYNSIKPHPAMGKTGENIKKYFLNNLFKAVYISDLNQEGAYLQASSKIAFQKYRLILSNLVPYQCSLGISLEETKNKEGKDDLLKKCIDEGKDEIIQQIANLNPTIIINCCTKDIKNDIQNMLNKAFPDKIRLEGCHPSSGFFASGFAIVR
ncbi:MAG: hypothetical protein SO206_01535 [Bacilli bacterium]|nr:hypothetical protein [Bacilli bacterium]